MDVPLLSGARWLGLWCRPGKLDLQHRSGDPSNVINLKRCPSSRTATKFVLITLLMASFNLLYLRYVIGKVVLFARHLRDTFEMPWLWAILAWELLVLVENFIGLVDQTWIPSFRTAPSSKLSVSRRQPTVDIFLCCCGEAVDVISDTLKAALALAYPVSRFKVFVLDDGADDELQATCQTLQAEYGGKLVYIRRVKQPGVPHNFKAGNMNHALQYSTAEYIAPVDADMILHQSFLQKLLPYLVDSPEVAFVQLPQTFYNLPAGDPLADGGFGWFEIIMPRRNAVGATPFIGTGAIFRRKCLDAVGGFQYQSATEDIMTTVALFSQGYKSEFVKEPLQIGLAAWTFKDFLKQRERWGVGAMHVWLGAWKELLGLKGNMTWPQRLIYTGHGYYYVMAAANTMMLLVLLAIMGLDLPMTVGSFQENLDVLPCLATAIALSRLASFMSFTHIKNGSLKRYQHEAHYWWIAPYNCMALKTMLLRKYHNIVTGSVSKVKKGGPQRFLAFRTFCSKLYLVQFHLGFVMLALAAIVYRVWDMTANYGSGDCQTIMLTIMLGAFILMMVQFMLHPVWVVFVTSKTRPKLEDRRSLLAYDVNGVPVYNPSLCAVPRTRFGWMLDIIPSMFTALCTISAVVTMHPGLRSEMTHMCVAGIAA